MNRNIFHGMRTGRDWHEIESRANWNLTDAVDDRLGDFLLTAVGCFDDPRPPPDPAAANRNSGSQHTNTRAGAVPCTACDAAGDD